MKFISVHLLGFEKFLAGRAGLSVARSDLTNRNTYRSSKRRLANPESRTVSDFSGNASMFNDSSALLIFFVSRIYAVNRSALCFRRLFTGDFRLLQPRSPAR